jgi:PAS domain S-box-containing protein
VWLDGEVRERFDYSIVGTPCETVVGRQFRLYPDRLGERFPLDADFAKLALQGYAGYPLNDARGAPLGLIAVVSRRPLPPGGPIESIVKIFAVRASAELERQRAEQALRESEASYRAIFEASEDAIFIHDWNTGAILDANPKACAAYGWSLEEMRRLTIDEMSSGSPPYTGADALQWIEAAKRGENPRIEWHRRNRDGSLHWDEVSLKSAMIGGAPRIIASTREITARKRAEEALRASEEQYRAIFNASADALTLWDGSLRLIDANPAYLRMYRVGRGEVVGRTFDELLQANPAAFRTYRVTREEAGVHTVAELGAAEYAKMRRQLIRDALAGHASRLETEAIRTDGARFSVELRSIPVTYRGAPHVLGIGRDMTGEREHEEALRRSEARLRATVAAAFDCVVGMDIDGAIIEFNPAAERTFGYTREEVLGRRLAELIIPERLRAAHDAGMAHYREIGAGPFLGRRVETVAMRSDGSELPVELAIAAVAAGRDGDIFIGYLRDISDAKRAEAENARLEAQLRQSQKMEAIGHLTGGIAHDFNNILTSVMGYVVLAAERPQSARDEKLAEYLAHAERSCLRARDLIQQMLMFSRGKRGERRPVALPELVGDLAGMLRSTLPTTLVLETRLQDVPTLVVDPVQIEQVLLNLCINARDATGGSGRIDVALRRSLHPRSTCASCRQEFSGEFVEFSIGDDGAGIPPDVFERIFEPFYSTKEVGRGSGMGLAVVHGILHEHGGHVTVDSTVGAGTTFRALLPLGSATGAEPTPARRALEAGDAGTRLAGRVLLAEDEASVAGFMRELLQNWGLAVTVVPDAEEALRALQHDLAGFDLLITDQTMPGLTGLELARRVAALDPSLPVLLYTGYADGLDATRLDAHGIQALLYKPVEPVALRRQVEAALAR